MIATQSLTLVDKLAMLARIQNSFIDFNDALGMDDPSKFDALRLHLAPQKAATWATMSAS